MSTGKKGKKIISDKWWNKTWNPINGCPDDGRCEVREQCWARGMSNRFHREFDQVWYKKPAIPKGEGKIVFVNNCADIGHDEVDFEVLALR